MTKQEFWMLNIACVIFGILIGLYINVMLRENLNGQMVSLKKQLATCIEHPIKDCVHFTEAEQFEKWDKNFSSWKMMQAAKTDSALRAQGVIR